MLEDLSILEISLVILAGVILLILALCKAQLDRSQRLNKSHYQKAWQGLQIHLKQPQTYPLAIIEADKLLDKALKEAGYKGDSMKDRLVSAQKHLSDSQSLWRAHKLRNRLVHEMNVTLSVKETKQTLEAFQKGLKNIGALPR
ncbi:MAG: hypothetical protein OXF30_00325 [Candidatus Saccharibacteria bacterium]|nr:hypothetical protein [Candidatus Saccharibacteria bacterium]